MSNICWIHSVSKSGWSQAAAAIRWFHLLQENESPWLPGPHAALAPAQTYKVAVTKRESVCATSWKQCVSCTFPQRHTLIPSLFFYLHPAYNLLTIRELLLKCWWHFLAFSPSIRWQPLFSSPQRTLLVVQFEPPRSAPPQLFKKQSYGDRADIMRLVNAGRQHALYLYFNEVTYRTKSRESSTKDGRWVSTSSWMNPQYLYQERCHLASRTSIGPCVHRSRRPITGQL